MRLNASATCCMESSSFTISMVLLWNFSRMFKCRRDKSADIIRGDHLKPGLRPERLGCGPVQDLFFHCQPVLHKKDRTQNCVCQAGLLHMFFYLVFAVEMR